MKGSIYGKLTLLEFHEKRNRRYFWKCLCECGNIVSYRLDALKLGRRKSCGCIRSPAFKEAQINLKERILNRSYQKDGCRIWNHTFNPQGYGSIKFQGKNLSASRASWIAHYGPIENNYFVLHICHNRACVNPDHLKLGTHVDNMKDMTNAGRQHKRPGEMHPVSKLIEKEVLEIREMYKEGKFSQAALSRYFGISVACLHNIVKRKSWTHI